MRLVPLDRRRNRAVPVRDDGGEDGDRRTDMLA